MPTSIDTLLDRHNFPDLRLLLQAVPRLGQEYNWEGACTGTRGSAAGSEIRVKARLGFYRDMIEGAGRAINFPSDLPSSAADFSISGFLANDSVSFQLWFGASELAGEPLVASGLLSGDGREMIGEWSIGCFSDPETCGCGGGGGDFRLKRVC